MLSIANEVNPLIFLLRMFCTQYKHVFFHQLASLSERVPFPFSSDLVEALAAVRAISFALEIGCLSFILEGDLEHVINTLNSNEDSLSPFGHILDSAKALTESSCISFFHVCRLGNFVACRTSLDILGLKARIKMRRFFLYLCIN